MPRFLQEPPHRHGNPASTAVVLVNLGTPEAPTGPALKRYLGQFLSDPRVVEAYLGAAEDMSFLRRKEPFRRTQA